MFYYVYVLQFKNNRELYKGYTKDLKLRLELHKKGKIDSTKNKGQFKLIYFEGCLNQQDATHREKYLKKFGQDVLKKQAQVLFDRVNDKK